MADKAKKSREAGESGKAAVPFMPYPGFEAMREDMERMMKRFTGADWMSGFGRMPALRDWPGMGGETPFGALLNLPRAEMAESDDGYELSVELPGLDEKDIELTLTDRALVLKGEKKAEKKSEEKDYHYSERAYGRIHRQFPLPDNVDRDAMKASFSKGVLTVSLPKSAQAKEKSRRIEVTAA